MNTYYIIDEENKLIYEFESDPEDVRDQFESWLNQHGGLREYLLVQKIFFGKLVIDTTMSIK